MRNTLLLGIAVLLVATSSTAHGRGGNGMTWAELTHGPIGGVDSVGCSGCNGYIGETACVTSLPILCIKQDGSSTPAGLATDFYHGWAKGNIATTYPVPGTSLTSIETANGICSSLFGSGWRMAEHHDGSGGWNWFAYGNIRSDMRMWVYINDQPGNCWNS